MGEVIPFPVPFTADAPLTELSVAELTVRLPNWRSIIANLTDDELADLLVSDGLWLRRDGTDVRDLFDLHEIG
jgi:hypothetical protein